MFTFQYSAFALSLATALSLSPQFPVLAAEAATALSAATAAIPEGCEPYSGRYASSGGLYCKKMIGGLKSGSGKDWGPFYSITAAAPAGYQLSWSEGHVFSQDRGHHCGVKDQADVAPSPRNGAGQLEGDAFWARCFIEERDSSHVKMEFRIQGEEGKTLPYIGDRGVGITVTDNKTLPGGFAEVWAIFVPVGK